MKTLWGSSYQLSDLLEGMPGGPELAFRDFALVTIAGQLSERFPRQLVFKGGFVLRHVHGFLRFSTDADSTRHSPPQHKLDADEVALAIREASIRDIVRFDPNGPPATDSARSLDFDRIEVSGAAFSSAQVQVEISYREEVVDEPEVVLLDTQFYEPFEILAMTMPEMAAEKLRALAQRVRPTDLADLAKMLNHDDVKDEDVARLATRKFELVKQGVANRVQRIEEHLLEMKADYDDVVPGLFPEASTYAEAMEVVWPRIKPLIP
jgi:predicted nucleotidyltransferase component of viral defense system